MHLVERKKSDGSEEVTKLTVFAASATRGSQLNTINKRCLIIDYGIEVDSMIGWLNEGPERVGRGTRSDREGKKNWVCKLCALRGGIEASRMYICSCLVQPQYVPRCCWGIKWSVPYLNGPCTDVG